MPPKAPTTLFLSLLAAATQRARETKDKKLCNNTIKIIEDMQSDLERARHALPADVARALANAHNELLELRTELDFT